MGTSWSEIVCNYAMPLIDDVRLSDQMEADPPLFFRRMALYVDLALPNLSRPQELYTMLKDGLTKPVYGDAEWVSDEASLSGQTVVSTGMTGFDLFCCSLRTVSDGGVVSLTPAGDVSYDSETGKVTFPVQSEAGLDYVMDFYTDGSFAKDLTDAVKRLLGLAVAVVWDERFSRNWLSLTMKVKDGSFETVNESNYMREAQSRLVSNRGLLNDELRKYEQDLAYRNTVSPRTGLNYV